MNDKKALGKSFVLIGFLGVVGALIALLLVPGNTIESLGLFTLVGIIGVVSIVLMIVGFVIDAQPGADENDANVESDMESSSAPENEQK